MSSRKSQTSRRSFLGTSAAFAGSLLASNQLLAAPKSPSERLQFGLIGVGGMGNSHLDWFAQHPSVEVVALCDVDQNHLQNAKPKVSEGCKLLTDFRELLALPNIDAVLIATPDHWHGLICIAAARAGKHIYCEKPLTNSIGEGRAVVQAVNEANVIFQTGSQERSNPGASIAKRLVGEGRLGEIKQIKINLPFNDPHLQEMANLQSTPPQEEVPHGFDYDFWLGHTPIVPYTSKRCHFWWRFHSAYGGGEMTDRGAHVIDLAQMILGLDGTTPVSFEATGEHSKGDFFDAFINFQFRNRYPSGLIMTGDNSGPRGVKFEGTEGSLFVAVHGAALSAEPASLLEDIAVPPATHHHAHRQNFLDAILEGAEIAAPVEAGHSTATICHLNNLAMQLGESLNWDPVTQKTDNQEANDLLTPEMRAPWTLDV